MRLLRRFLGLVVYVAFYPLSVAAGLTDDEAIVLYNSRIRGGEVDLRPAAEAGHVLSKIRCLRDDIRGITSTIDNLVAQLEAAQPDFTNGRQALVSVNELVRLQTTIETLAFQCADLENEKERLENLHPDDKTFFRLTDFVPDESSSRALPKRVVPFAEKKQKALRLLHEKNHTYAQLKGTLVNLRDSLVDTDLRATVHGVLEGLDLEGATEQLVSVDEFLQSANQESKALDNILNYINSGQAFYDHDHLCRLVDLVFRGVENVLDQRLFGDETLREEFGQMSCALLTLIKEYTECPTNAQLWAARTLIGFYESNQTAGEYARIVLGIKCLTAAARQMHGFRADDMDEALYGQSYHQALDQALVQYKSAYVAASFRPYYSLMRDSDEFQRRMKDFLSMGRDIEVNLRGKTIGDALIALRSVRGSGGLPLFETHKDLSRATYVQWLFIHRKGPLLVRVKDSSLPEFTIELLNQHPLQNGSLNTALLMHKENALFKYSTADGARMVIPSRIDMKRWNVLLPSGLPKHLMRQAHFPLKP